MSWLGKVNSILESGPFPKRAQKSAQNKRRPVLHNRSVGRVTQLTCLGKCVFDLPKSIDEFVFERILTRKNAPIRDGIAQTFCWKIAFARDDAEKFIVRFHDETLDVIAFFRRDRPRTVKHVLEFAALKNNRREPDFIE